jgi:hypothetical protein
VGVWGAIAPDPTANGVLVGCGNVGLGVRVIITGLFTCITLANGPVVGEALRMMVGLG